jgi:hypothetical protein
MRRAALVDQHAQLRMTLEQRSGRPGVIEVDVREDDVRDVSESDALSDELALEHRQATGRTRVDQRYASGALDDGGGDCVGTAEKLEVDVRQAWG